MLRKYTQPATTRSLCRNTAALAVHSQHPWELAGVAVQIGEWFDGPVANYFEYHPCQPYIRMTTIF